MVPGRVCASVMDKPGHCEMCQSFRFCGSSETLVTRGHPVGGRGVFPKEMNAPTVSPGGKR